MKNYIFCFFLCTSLCYSQDVLDVLKKVDAVFNGKTCLKFNATYKLFKSTKDNKPSEIYNSLFCKNELNEVYIKTKNLISIENDSFVLQLDTNDKVAVLANANKNTKKSKVFDLEELSKYGKIVEFKKNNSGWYLVFDVNEKVQMMYNRIEIYINSNFTIQKEILHLRQVMDFSKDIKKSDLKLPILEITFSEYSFEKLNSTIFNFSNYFTINNKNVCVLKEKYKQYTLKDLRY